MSINSFFFFFLHLLPPWGVALALGLVGLTPGPGICYMYVNEPSKVHDSFSPEKDKKIKLDMLTTFWKLR